MQTRWEYAKKCAYKFLKDNRIMDFPVNLFEIIDNHGWGIMTCDEYMFKKGIPPKRMNEMMMGGDALVVLEKRLYTIIIKPGNPKRLRFSLAHEIGHIMLNHLVEFPNVEEVYEVLEQEADVFAARLLVPFVVMWEEGISKASDIASYFNVSMSCAKNRLEEHRRLMQLPDVYTWFKEAEDYKECYRRYRGENVVYSPKAEQVVCGYKSWESGREVQDRVVRWIHHKGRSGICSEAD